MNSTFTQPQGESDPDSAGVQVWEDDQSECHLMKPESGACSDSDGGSPWHAGVMRIAESQRELLGFHSHGFDSRLESWMSANWRMYHQPRECIISHLSSCIIRIESRHLETDSEHLKALKGQIPLKENSGGCYQIELTCACFFLKNRD